MTTETATTQSVSREIDAKREQLQSLNERRDLAIGRLAAEREQLTRRVASGDEIGRTSIHALELEQQTLTAAIDQTTTELAELEQLHKAAAAAELGQSLDAAVAEVARAAKQYRADFRAAFTKLRPQYDALLASMAAANSMETQATGSQWPHRAARATGALPGAAMAYVTTWLDDNPPDDS